MCFPCKLYNYWQHPEGLHSEVCIYFSGALTGVCGLRGLRLPVAQLLASLSHTSFSCAQGSKILCSPGDHIRIKSHHYPGWRVISYLDIQKRPWIVHSLILWQRRSPDQKGKLVCQIWGRKYVRVYKEDLIAIKGSRVAALWHRNADCSCKHYSDTLLRLSHRCVPRCGLPSETGMAYPSLFQP